MVTASMSLPLQERNLRQVVALVALGWVILTFGLYFEAGWATWVWPWADARMTYVFLSSIAAAVAAPLAWLAMVDEPAAIAGMAIDGIVIGGAMTAVMVGSSFADDDPRLLVFAVGMAIAVIATAFVFRNFHPWPIHDRTPQPRFLTWYFVVLVLVLIPVGLLLIVQTDGMFPWDLPGRTSSMIGGVFIGASTYFIYGLRLRSWVHTGGQLAGFLAYSIVLGVPYWRTVIDQDAMSASGGYQAFPGQVLQGQDEQVNQLSLYIYTGVISVAALVSVWYLFVNGETRIQWRRHTDL